MLFLKVVRVLNNQEKKNQAKKGAVSVRTSTVSVRASTVSALRYMALIGHLGLVMVIAVGATLYIGMLIDRQFGTKAVFTIIFVFIGISGGFLGVYRAICSMEFQNNGFNSEDKSGITDGCHEDGEPEDGD